MATPIKETKSDASPEGEEKFYSMDEVIILTKMETFMNGKPFHFLDQETSVSEQERDRRKVIVSELTGIVTDIRLKKTEERTLFEYQDVHFDEPEYAWLQELHPGVNVSGWGVVMILMNPMTYGKNIDRPVQNVHGTITQRSAKN